MKKASSLVILLCCLMWISACQKEESLPLGVWKQQEGDHSDVHYLRFTKFNTLEIYKQPPNENCLIALLAGASAMSFRKTAPDEIQFEVMGTVSIMRFVIEDETLKFSFDDRTRAVFGHNDFLDGDYGWVGDSLNTCVITMREWMQRAET